MKIDCSAVKYLSDTEKAAIQFFLEKISDVNSIRICKVFLFGSKARGDFHSFSDIDLLILVEDNISSNERWELSSIAAEVSIDYEVVINCVYYNEMAWDDKDIANPTLKYNVEKDGIVIAL